MLSLLPQVIWLLHGDRRMRGVQAGAAGAMPSRLWGAGDPGPLSEQSDLRGCYASKGMVGLP